MNACNQPLRLLLLLSYLLTYLFTYLLTYILGLHKEVLEPGLRVMGHLVTWSTILVGTGRVGSRVNVTDRVSDPVFVFFARDLLLPAAQAPKKELMYLYNCKRHSKIAVS